MLMSRRGLLDGGTEERYGLMSFGNKDMFPMRRKIRHWHKNFKRRHLFWALMVLVFMSVFTKFLLLNMFSDQLDMNPQIHSNVVEDDPSSPNTLPVYENIYSKL